MSKELNIDIEAGKVNVIKYVGLLLSIREPKDVHISWDIVKEKAIEYIQSNTIVTSPDFFFGISMPCEHGMVFDTLDDIRELPIKDIPCSCGDSTHWFVRFEEIKN